MEEDGAVDVQVAASVKRQRRRKVDLNHEMKKNALGSPQWCCKTCPQTFLVQSQWVKHERNMLDARTGGLHGSAACDKAFALDGIDGRGANAAPPSLVLGFAALAAEVDAGAAAVDPSLLAAAIINAPTGPHNGHLDPGPTPELLSNDEGGDEEDLPLEAGPLQLVAMDGLPSPDERLSYDDILAAVLEEMEGGGDQEGEEHEGVAVAVDPQAGPEVEEVVEDEDDFFLDDLMDAMELALAADADAGVTRMACAMTSIEAAFSDPKWRQAIFPGATVSLLVHCYAKLREKSAGHIRNRVFDRMLQYDSKVTGRPSQHSKSLPCLAYLIH